MGRLSQVYNTAETQGPPWSNRSVFIRTPVGKHIFWMRKGQLLSSDITFGSAHTAASCDEIKYFELLRTQGGHVFSDSDIPPLCHFTYLTEIYVNLLQIQTFCHKANNTGMLMSTDRPFSNFSLHSSTRQEGVDRIHLAHNRHLRVPQKAYNFSTSWATISSSRRSIECCR